MITWVTELVQNQPGQCSEPLEVLVSILQKSRTDRMNIHYSGDCSGALREMGWVVQQWLSVV